MRVQSSFPTRPRGPVLAAALLAVLAALAGTAIAAQSRDTEFPVLAVLDAGKNPHQIAFSPDGRTAYVAAAGSDWIALIDVPSRRVVSRQQAEGVPLGVQVLPGGESLTFTSFRSSSITRLGLPGFGKLGDLETGVGSSLLIPLPEGSFLVSTEQADRLWVLDGGAFNLLRHYPTGKRPFPPAATSDGRKAFVPGYDDGTVTVIDLWNQRVLDTVQVGQRPSGGAVLPGDIDYLVAVRGEDHLAFINTASHQVVGRLRKGIGKLPFSIVVTPNGRLGFINNTASHDISVLDVERREVLGRLGVGEIPIVMAVHPSGETLWVSSEGSHRVTVFEIPSPWRKPPQAAQAGGITEVAVLGMIHGAHRSSQSWGLEQVEQTIRRIRPDVICAEIPPDRWDRIWRDYSQERLIEDDRIRLFPEYTEVLLPLKLELGFEVEPCAAWSKEMSDLRRERVRQFNSESRFVAQKQEYDRRLAEVRARQPETPQSGDDPRFIHSDLHDRLSREELALYDEYLNDWIGPGGWANINQGHMRLIDGAIRRHRGKRLLITFGAGHKYWFLDRLRERGDVRLVDVTNFLPALSGQQPVGASGEEEESMNKKCRSEVIELHQFFEDWLVGRLENSDASFQRLSGVLAEDFQIIGPSGSLTPRDQLLSGLRRSHGPSDGKDFRIWIENYQGRPLGQGLFLVTYQEWQQDGEASKGRLSTAVFRQKPGTPNGVEWVHVHEVWLPGAGAAPQ